MMDNKRFHSTSRSGVLDECVKSPFFKVGPEGPKVWADGSYYFGHFL